MGTARRCLEFGKTEPQWWLINSKNMKLTKIVCTVVCSIALVASPALAGEKTCCQKASAEGKECTHKCCAAAHKAGKSCEKCNPNKEDLKLKKKDNKTNKTTDKPSNKPS